MKAGQVILSKRLQMLADMVSAGNRLADVGCDHGFLSIYLVQKGICPRALAMDVRKGPLEAAKTHVAECGLHDYIETRLSDGMKAAQPGEADTMVCAGMGGPLMEKILNDSMEKVQALKELILQPQSEIREFREFLRKSGFVILAEDAVIDEGKYYFAMKVAYRGDEETKTVGIGAAEIPLSGKNEMEQKLFDTYGKYLLLQKHPVLLSYLKQRKEYVEKLLMSLKAVGSEKAMERLGEVEAECEELEQALTYFEG